MTIIYDLADPQELLGFTRGIQQELEANTFVLNQFLPNDNIDEIEYRFTQGALKDQDVATVRSWDTEAPIGNRQGIKRIMGELPPISKKMAVGEEERLRLRMLERSGDASQIIQAIYNDAGNLARSVAGRVELFRGEALETGQIVINENGVRPDPIVFGRQAAHSAAANTLTGTNVWTDYANSDPIAFLQGLVDTYTATNGGPPGLFLTSRKAINHLLRNAKIRTYLGSLAGTPQLVTNDQLRQVLTAFDLPPLVAYDVVVRLNGVQTRVISDDKVIGLPPAGEPLGRTFFGTTAEAIELAAAQQIANDQVPGMVSVVEKTFDPVKTWTKVAAIALPVLANPDLTIVGDVF
jgi:hypothetical protein